MKSVMMNGRVWFRCDPEEVQYLVAGLTCAKVEDELDLEEYHNFLSITRQMELRRNINRYQALIEQFTQGYAY